MIIGLGSDLCDIRRIEGTLERFGERFLARVFTPVERAKALRRSRTTAGTLAKRFAAKEACAKALGTGIAQGVSWREMGVENDPSGRPHLVLTGNAAAILAALCPAGMMPRLHLTMTDDYPLAQAFVVIEAVPAADARAASLPAP